MPSPTTDEDGKFIETVFFGLIPVRHAVYSIVVFYLVGPILFPFNPVIFVSLGLLFFLCVHFGFPKVIYDPLYGTLFVISFNAFPMALMARTEFWLAKNIVAYVFCNDVTYELAPETVSFYLFSVGSTLRGHLYLLENAKKAFDHKMKTTIQEVKHVDIHYLD